MRKYRLVIAYDGTDYAGWQVQPHATTIQSMVEDQLAKILRSRPDVVGAGRTDAGVHAKGQVAHFIVKQPIDLYRVHHSLNGLLPSDIRIVSMDEAASDFHARYSATGKFYSYEMTLGRVQNPFQRRYQWHYTAPLNLAAIHNAMRCLVGEHDFTSFANSPTQGSVAHDPIRTLRQCELVETPVGIRFEFEGEGFLYKMVRNLVGTLVQIGGGKAHDMQAILAVRDRRCAGPAAPPHGLCLERVIYEDLLEGSQVKDAVS